MQTEAERVAQAAYDNPNAEAFYSQIWGGSDIHLGVYEFPAESIASASVRTMDRMATKIQQESIDHVLDLGSGYCGAARYLHDRFDADMLAINLSREQNQRAEMLNRKAGVHDRITVTEASFNNVPAEDASVDLVWSQDAFLHAERRDLPVSEAARVLRDGGEFIFADPMAADGVPQTELTPVLDRLNLSSLGSPEEYRRIAGESGLVEVEFEDLSEQLATHYGRVLEETQARREDLLKVASEQYLEKMMLGLRNWVDAGTRGLLSWGIFHFRKQ